MVYNEALASRVRSVLAGRQDVEEKKMFGGLTFMVAGKMCCGVLKDDLVLRVGEEHLQAALATPYVRPFDFTGRPSAGMAYIASAGLTDDQVLREWVQRGLEQVTAEPKKPRKR